MADHFTSIKPMLNELGNTRKKQICTTTTTGVTMVTHRPTENVHLL